MDKIEVQGSLIFEHHGYLYKVDSDVYKWDPDHVYNAGEFVLFRDMLFKARIRTLGSWIANFDKVAPTDRITTNATNDDLQPIYRSLSEIRAALGLDTPVTDDDLDPGIGLPPSPQKPPLPQGPEDEDPIDPGFGVDKDLKELVLRVDNIEQTYVRTINHEPALGGNINIDYDGSVQPPESNILRWDNNTLKLKPEQSLQYIVDDVVHNIVQYDDGLVFGSSNTHLDIQSVDGLTVNGEPVVTSETVVDLINDQNVFGRKHFESIFTTEAPQEDHQIPNKSWIVSTIDDAVATAVKPRLNSDTVFYIDAESLVDAETGTKESPFKTLKNAVDYIKKLDLNFHPVTIEFLGPYTDNSELLELPNLGSNVKIVSKIEGVELPPLFVTGSWILDGVTLTDNRLAQCPLEVNRGYCVLEHVSIKLKTPAPGTAAIFVCNSGTLQLASGGELNIVNESSVNVVNAICIDAGTLLGNQDVHANVGEANAITVSNDNAGFAVGILAKHGARCLYLENTDYAYMCLPYVAKQASVIQGLRHNQEGERDASSMVTA